MKRKNWPAPARAHRYGRALGLIGLLLLLLAAGAAGAIALVHDQARPESTTSAAETTAAQPPAESTDAPAPQTTQPSAESAPASAEVTDASAEPQDAAALAMEILSGMTLDARIYQLFIVTQDQLTGVTPVTVSREATQAAIGQYPVGGIVYFAKNLVSRAQCTAMINGIQSFSQLGLFIAVDEEGGSVARLGSNPAMGTTAFPAMKKIGSTKDPDRAYAVGYTLGTDLAALGFNLDFAPVADVDANPNNPVIGSRAFSSDPDTAAAMVSACVNGFGDSGVLCTLKHFPGHGDTSTDSHYGEAEITKTLADLYECELIPFQAGIEAGAPLVMVGHLTLPQVIDAHVPASLSPEIVTGLLRDTLGFDGLIITDSLSMQAITDQYSPGEAAVKAIAAGVDILLMPESLPDAVSGIRAAIASGELTEERINASVLRILQVKIQYGIIQP